MNKELFALEIVETFNSTMPDNQHAEISTGDNGEPLINIIDYDDDLNFSLTVDEFINILGLK